METVVKDEAELMAPDDAELIIRAKDGELDAFGELYKRHVSPIYRYIRLRVSDEQIAEDLAEDVFLRAFTALRKYKERGVPFSAFLFRITRNLLVDHYRTNDREASLETTENMASLAPTLDEGLMMQDRIHALQKAFPSLPEDYQEVIRLRVLLTMPTPNVAALMDRSEGAVRVLLHRALTALREKVTENDN
jgi:RNA polymerase sigma-70 factor (ECF subfamily)